MIVQATGKPVNCFQSNHITYRTYYGIFKRSDTVEVQPVEFTCVEDASLERLVKYFKIPLKI